MTNPDGGRVDFYKIKYLFLKGSRNFCTMIHVRGSTNVLLIKVQYTRPKRLKIITKICYLRP